MDIYNIISYHIFSIFFRIQFSYTWCFIMKVQIFFRNCILLCFIGTLGIVILVKFLIYELQLKLINGSYLLDVNLFLSNFG